MTTIHLIQKLPHAKFGQTNLTKMVVVPIVPRVGDVVVLHDARCEVKRIELYQDDPIPRVYAKNYPTNKLNRKQYNKLIEAKHSAGWSITYTKPTGKSKK